ncbi:MAG: bifunctional diguanylate cyclase/phosphodiesterase [Dissulfurimicrobium sp.]
MEPSLVLSTLKAVSKAVLLDMILESYSYFAVREKRLGEAKKTIERVNRAFQVIHEINDLIVRATDLNKLLDNATRIIVETGGFALAWIGMVDPQTGLILPRAAHGLTDYLKGIKVSIDPSLPEGQGPTGTAAREKKVIVVQAIGEDPRFLPWKEMAQRFGLRSASALPIVIAGEAKGTLNIYSTRYASFTDTEVALLEEVAGDIAYAIDHMEKEEEVERLLFWDGLTGLGNHNRFTAYLASHLQILNSEKDHCLVLILDIDRFRVINHALGVPKGDLVLKEIANRLKVFAGDSGDAARFGADEFGLALDICNKNPLTVIEELRRLISLHPIRLDGDEISVSASMGLAVFPENGLQASQLIERAKMALSEAKKQGEDQICFYSHELFEKNLKKVELERELKEALKNREFVLFFQPKIDLLTREIAGFEALIRWQHPEKGLIPPGEFIPFLEESGLMVEVGKWVMEEAIRHIKESPVCKDSRMVISFNVSFKQFEKQFEQPGFIQELIETVKASGVDPKRLQIEVTEGLLMKNTRETIEKLARIHEAGLGISIDDFGTGYSSLQYLKDLPASTLKIDYSFVKGLPDERDDVEIVKTILLLAQGLGKKTVAEGVETREQLVFLAELGVNEVQGFYFARPMPKGECIKWIEDYRPETYFWPRR